MQEAGQKETAQPWRTSPKVGDCLKSDLQPHGLAPCPRAAFVKEVLRTGGQDGQAATKQPGSLFTNYYNSPNVSAAVGWRKADQGILRKG